MISQKYSMSEPSRKDKRRHNLELKVGKIYSNFVNNRDNYYKERLTTLQTDLTTLHQGNNKWFLRKLRDFEEARDLELVRLRLYEEYRISRSSIEFQEDIEKAKKEHETLVKLCKEKLYESLEQKIKSLQEERLLMDVANVHSYAMDYSRTRFQKNTRSHTANGWDSSSNTEFSAMTNRDSPNESATDTGTERRSLRRRVAKKSMSTTNLAKAGEFDKNSTGTNNEFDETSDFQTNHSKTATSNSANTFDMNSDAEFLQYISDHSELHNLLFGETKPANNSPAYKKKPKNAQRYSAKSAPPLPSLSFDEVTEDISLIRRLTDQPPAPFKLKQDQ